MVIAGGLINSAYASKVNSNHVEAIVKNKSYKIDWTIIVTFCDSAQNEVCIDKNTHARHDTISAKSSTSFEAKSFNCSCGDSDHLLATIGVKTKVTSDGKLKISNRHDIAILSGGCDIETSICDEQLGIPKLKKGTYNLIFDSVGEESDDYYITKIKIS